MGTKLEQFLQKNQHIKRKLLNFDNCCIGECQKVSKLDFQSQFSMPKIIRIFLIFFLLNNTNYGAHVLVLTFFDTSILKLLYY